jgi:hypothetical protein
MEGRHRPWVATTCAGCWCAEGTILGTSRVDPYVHGDGLRVDAGGLAETGVDGLVVIGGDGSLRTASPPPGKAAPCRRAEDDRQRHRRTDVSFGFHTAVQIVTDAIDRLTTTAEAHNRVMVVEVMGRTTGWIASYAGMAGGAEASWSRRRNTTSTTWPLGSSAPRRRTQLLDRGRGRRECADPTGRDAVTPRVWTRSGSSGWAGWVR